MQNNFSTGSGGTNHKAGRYTCIICNKRFTKPSLLRRHEVVHLREKPFKCCECHKLFTQNSSLQRHFLEQHESNKKRYQCTKCPQSFSQKSNLHSHDKKVHQPMTGGKEVSSGYPCNHCPAKYCNKQKLSAHTNKAHKLGFEHNNKIINFDDVEDDLALTQTVLEQLKTFQIEMQALETPTVRILENVELPQQQHQVDERLAEEVRLEKSIHAQPTNEYEGRRALYSCDYCTKQFRKSYDFFRHCRVHTRDKPHKCRFCERAFSIKTRLNEHMKIHRLDAHLGLLTRHYPCAVCGQAYSSLRQLDKHMNSHVSKYYIQYRCEMCDAIYKTSMALSSHKHEKTGEEFNFLKQILPKPIELSSGISKSRTNSEIVQKSNLGAAATVPLCIKRPKWICPLCSRLFASSSVLNSHRRIYHGAHRHTLGHISTTLPKRCFKCPYCARYFNNKSNCNAHMLKHLKGLLNTTDDATNQQTSNVINALVIVTDIATHHIIVKQFNAVTTHKRVAGNAVRKTRCAVRKKRRELQRNKCHFCLRQFTKLCDLKRHLFVHTGERLHKCPTCDKSFSLSSTLKQHQLTHECEQRRPKCVCIVCGKIYLTKKALNVHLRLHTGEQPFECEWCEMKFRTSGQRIAHLRKAHGM